MATDLTEINCSRPGCIFSVFHHSEHVQRYEQRSSHGQYVHVYQPLSLRWAMPHCQLPFQGMRHLPTKPVRMYYRSGTDDVCYFHSPDGSICLHELKLQQLSAQNEAMAVVLKLRSQVEYPTVNRCIFTSGTILPNFVLIRFETTES